MALGDGIRRNIAHVSMEERRRFRDAIVQLNRRKYPDQKTKWVKQNQIHSHASHVHRKPSFLPWHRELCNRFELLLREVDAELSLHYWDWTEDPREASDGADGTVNLFTTEFMGVDKGLVGFPFTEFPPFEREVKPSEPKTDTDATIIDSTQGFPQGQQWKIFREKLEGDTEHNHDLVHSYIGGSISDRSTAFKDPFVFLIHSNVDRLWAMWQRQPGKGWRLDPDKIYGDESHAHEIIDALEPWAGKGKRPLRPWGPPDYEDVVKNSKDLTIVVPPRYDTLFRSRRNVNHH